MYLHVVSSLPTEIGDELEDILANPPATDPYNQLKTAVLARNTTSERNRLQHLLNMEELCDQRPFELLRRMRERLSGTTEDTDTSFLREDFLQRLPSSMVVVLATADDMHLHQLANLAD